ncbi:hypothetical protein H5410_060634 [Solanum commersonii]|uniref:Uncharacterized protein n=1 Tax=Solanum commersonii TaxID=4109 RepID=A0A9J5W6M5_SOLCO|nr:hypothetical protein H5410_060634 [Solanum commersonii]
MVFLLVKIQKIETKLIEFENASNVSFSERNKPCFSMHIRLQLGLKYMFVLCFFHKCKPFFLLFTYQEKILDKFFVVKLEDHYRKHAEAD